MQKRWVTPADCALRSRQLTHPTAPSFWQCLLGPHAVVQRFGFVLQQWTDDLRRPLTAGKDLAARQIERRVLRMVAGDAAQAVLAEAVDDAADAGPVDRAGA